IDIENKAGFFENNHPFNIVNISDFNSLIAQSQKHKTPVFELSDEEIEQGGKILVNMKKSQKDFLRVFDEFANNVIGLTTE
ncbi:hypothetical protein, partial [Acinetobacter baumannii]